MENTNTKENNKKIEIFDVVCELDELTTLQITIAQLAIILKTNYLEDIPITEYQKEYFVSSFYSMNELVNVIYDYSHRVKDKINAVSDMLIKIKSDMKQK